MFERRRPAVIEDPDKINYKDVDLLTKCLSPQGKLQPRRRLGCDAKTQHKVRQAIHRARFIGLLPYGS